MALAKEQCPRCKELYSDGMIKVMGRPLDFKKDLNEVIQCLKCKFIFSPKDAD